MSMLPTEIWAHIAAFCCKDATDLVRSSHIAKACYNASDFSYLWRNLQVKMHPETSLHCGKQLLNFADDDEVSYTWKVPLRKVEATGPYMLLLRYFDPKSPLFHARQSKEHLLQPLNSLYESKEEYMQASVYLNKAIARKQMRVNAVNYLRAQESTVINYAATLGGLLLITTVFLMILNFLAPSFTLWIPNLYFLPAMPTWLSSPLSVMYRLSGLSFFFNQVSMFNLWGLDTKHYFLYTSSQWIGIHLPFQHPFSGTVMALFPAHLALFVGLLTLAYLSLFGSSKHRPQLPVAWVGLILGWPLFRIIQSKLIYTLAGQFHPIPWYTFLFPFHFATVGMSIASWSNELFENPSAVEKMLMKLGPFTALYTSTAFCMYIDGFIVTRRLWVTAALMVCIACLLAAEIADSNRKSSFSLSKLLAALLWILVVISMERIRFLLLLAPLLLLVPDMLGLVRKRVVIDFDCYWYA